MGWDETGRDATRDAKAWGGADEMGWAKARCVNGEASVGSHRLAGSHLLDCLLKVYPTDEVDRQAAHHPHAGAPHAPRRHVLQRATQLEPKTLP